MSKKRTYALIVAVVGFIVLLVGSLSYMDVYALGNTPSCILMGIGIVAVIGALLVISLSKEANEHAA